MLSCAIEPCSMSVLPPADTHPLRWGRACRQCARAGGGSPTVTTAWVGCWGRGRPGPERLSANRAERELLSALELVLHLGPETALQSLRTQRGRVGVPSRTCGRSSAPTPPGGFPEVRGAAPPNPHPRLGGSYSLTTVLLHGGENSTAKKRQTNRSRYSLLTSAPWNRDF